MARCTVPEAEAVLDKSIPVLDKGFVRLVDYLGSDERIVQSARVSYGGGTKSCRRDRGLIRYLLRNGHTSPFEQVVFTFHIKMPIFVARQWIRHRTGRVNEISGRYSVMADDFYLPALEDVALQSDDNKQGRQENPVPPEEAGGIIALMQEEQERSYQGYERLLDKGLARELARINLPLSLYTEWYWQMDLHNLFHFLKLRLDPHAQREIRAYSKVILSLVENVCPIACEAFTDFILRGSEFSAVEMEVLKKIAAQAADNESLSSLPEGEREIFLKKLGM